MAESEPSISIPSLLTLAVVSFFVLRWLLSSRTSSSNGSNGRTRGGGGRRIDPAQLEQISQMFPQLSRRDIVWDLQRNGGSAAATTERILTGRGLETPPPSFQPQLPSAPNQRNGVSRSSTAQAAPKVAAEDLISRYNLKSRLNEELSVTGAASPDSTIIHQESAWSRDKAERQRLLQKRRDDMILAARRKMLEKDRAKQQV
ncbi:hypothetical protein FQN57_003032 [Myotisia sp. PD_48]|nr:hypothetical protein FQN57_003032 [Myotisia sp. PD_48]